MNQYFKIVHSELVEGWEAAVHVSTIRHAHDSTRTGLVDRST